MFRFFSKNAMLDEASQQKVQVCIKEAESKTTGEIRVFVEHKCTYMDAMDRARELFFKLGMEKTTGRNAVIVYLALQDRQYAIYGDVSIHEKTVEVQLWQTASNQLKTHLRNDQIAEGLVNCISEIGKALAQHFPFDPSVVRNELPDEIVFGK